MTKAKPVHEFREPFPEKQTQAHLQLLHANIYLEKLQLFYSPPVVYIHLEFNYPNENSGCREHCPFSWGHKALDWEDIFSRQSSFILCMRTQAATQQPSSTTTCDIQPWAAEGCWTGLSCLSCVAAFPFVALGGSVCHSGATEQVHELQGKCSMSYCPWCSQIPHTEPCYKTLHQYLDVKASRRHPQ